MELPLNKIKMPPVEIQWCDHSSVLLEYFRQLYEEGRFVDVGLECESKQVKAHKAVISACSPYLEGLLKGNPARSHLIKFNGYSYSSLQAVIDFMYNGSVLIEQEQLAAFLKLGRALQVRGILDIASQCEEAGLTTAEETKSNAQYSTTVQQSQKAQQNTATPSKQIGQSAESKKYAFMLDKQQQQQPSPKKPVTQQSVMRKQDAAIKAQQAHQIQQQQQQQQQQEQLQQQEQAQQAERQVVASEANTVDQTTLEELQQALASGQALLQADGTSGDQTLQMMEGQCVVTGSGQTYVVVQDGDNISFVPAEMVQGVNGGQEMEDMDPVEQQLAQMEGVEAGVGSTTDGAEGATEGNGVAGTNAQDQMVTSSEGTASHPEVGTASAGGETVATGGEVLETMSVVESLVKLGEKQPGEEGNAGDGVTPEVGADMPNLDTGKSDETEDAEQSDTAGNKGTTEQTDQDAESMSNEAKIS